MTAIASAGFIISTEIIRTHLGIGTTGDDSWLDKNIASVTKKIETYCRRTFAVTHFTEYHDGTGKRGFFYVRNFPIIAISELNDDVNRDFATATAYATSAYITYADEGRVELLHSDDLTGSLEGVRFQKGQQNIKIVYTGGYASIPEDVSYGATEWISKLYHRRDKKEWNTGSRSKGDKNVSVIPVGSMPDDVKEFIHPYRVMMDFDKRR